MLSLHFENDRHVKSTQIHYYIEMIDSSCRGYYTYTYILMQRGYYTYIHTYTHTHINFWKDERYTYSRTYILFIHITLTHNCKYIESRLSCAPICCHPYLSSHSRFYLERVHATTTTNHLALEYLPRKLYLPHFSLYSWSECRIATPMNTMKGCDELNIQCSWHSIVSNDKQLYSTGMLPEISSECRLSQVRYSV